VPVQIVFDRHSWSEDNDRGSTYPTVVSFAPANWASDAAATVLLWGLVAFAGCTLPVPTT
jgi:hypothetical protein